MNAFELLSDYAFVIIFVIIAFFQWFVTKFRRKDDTDVFEWPEDDETGDARQPEDPLAEIRRRLEERMSGGAAAPPPVPKHQPGSTPPPQPLHRSQQRQPILSERDGFTHKPRQGFVEREREALAAKKAQLDAKTEQLAAKLQQAKSRYGARPERKFGSDRRGRVQKFLASPDSIRDAILLQEILGTPRSQRLL